MSYKYTHLIPQNIAPVGVKQISVYNSQGRKVCSIPLGRLTPPTREPLYSFGIFSDIHLWKSDSSAYNHSNTKFDKALSYLENRNCAFCVVCGDLTITGLYLRTDEAVAGTEYLDEGQFAAYKEICNKHTIPVYELCGNHESYYSQPISNNLALLETYTGKGVLSYAVEHKNDMFILLGQPSPNRVMSDGDFSWLSETLEANTDKRCFVFIHPYIEEDSGDPLDVRENSIFDYWGTTKTNAFINLLSRYSNVILFHGHSHMKFELQEVDVDANYTEKNGFKSVNASSLSTPRDILYTYNNNGVITETIVPDTSGGLGTLTKITAKGDGSASQGYIVDVYDDCIVLNGWDFVGNKPVPLGTYKIPM